MTPALADVLRRGARALGVPIDEAGVARVGRHLDLLLLWRTRVRLTGEDDPDAILRKHVLDSVAVCRQVPRGARLVDVGSGAGFPGIVVACVRPDVAVSLIESRRRRASFLAEAVRSIPLASASVHALRAEEAGRLPELARRADVVTARAVRLDQLLAVAPGLLAPGGRVVAMQAARADTAARPVVDAPGFAVEKVDEYVLAGGERRRLVVLRAG